MPRVMLTGQLRRHLACRDAVVEGGTVRQALDALFAGQPALRSYIVDDQGRLRRHVNVFVNDNAIADRAGLSDPVAPGDEIFILQALSGG
jgi:molybdopterin converting factor small subunit